MAGSLSRQNNSHATGPLLPQAATHEAEGCKFTSETDSLLEPSASGLEAQSVKGYKVAAEADSLIPQSIASSEAQPENGYELASNTDLPHTETSLSLETHSVKRCKTASDTEPLLPQTVISRESHAAKGYHGLLWIAASTFGFAFITIVVRLTATRLNYPPSAAVLLRSISHLVFSSIYLISFRISPAGLQPSDRAILFLRGLLGTAAMVCAFNSLKFLPAGEATSIFAFSPIITIFLSKVVLNETTSVWDVTCAVVGFVGIILIGNPDASGPLWILGAVLVFCGACFSACAYVCVRRMGFNVHFMLSVFSLGVCGVPVTALLGGRVALQQILTNKVGTGIVFLGSFGSFFGQICLTKGLQMSNAGQGIIMKNLEVPVAYLLSIIVLGERPTPTRIQGSILVVSAVVIVGIRQLLHREDPLR